MLGVSAGGGSPTRGNVVVTLQLTGKNAWNTQPASRATLRANFLSFLANVEKKLELGSPALLVPGSTALIASSLSGAKPPGFNGLVIAIDPAAFGDPKTFVANVSSLAAAIHALPLATGVDAVLLPGERGRRLEAQRRAAGIALPRGVASELAGLAGRLGVIVPTVLATAGYEMHEPLLAETRSGKRKT